MNNSKTNRGSAPTLAIFMIFVIVSSGLVVAYLHTMDENRTASIQTLMASDLARATNSSINAELNEELNTAITAAMWDVGTSSGNRESVENRVIAYLNNRISKGWSYPNMNVEVPLADENSVFFDWQADGSVTVRAYLESEVEHVKGPSSFGTFLHAAPFPRFLRIKHVAEQTSDLVEGVSSDQISKIEKELNDNYETEGIKIELNLENNRVKIRVTDIYGGKAVVNE